ncbi:hypothetical protein AAFP30_18555 [Gordonia sp. CPCC 205515]|uniref:hypothetical protein n=1 Tax=Gordonia sp. CPCC 205515 TaxID=3140791 RepID=UPI003AF3A6B0
MPADDAPLELNALAVNVAIPDHLRWNDSRRREEFTLTTITVRLLPDGHLAAKAYGRPKNGGRGGYTSFRVSDSPEIADLINAAATRAADLWAGHQGIEL